MASNPIEEDIDALTAEFASVNKPEGPRVPVGGLTRPVYHAPTTFSTYSEQPLPQPLPVSDYGTARKPPAKLDPTTLPSRHTTRGNTTTFGAGIYRPLMDIVEEHAMKSGGSSTDISPVRGKVGSRASQMPKEPVVPYRQQIMLQKILPRTGGSAPKPRWGATAVAHEGILYVLGGVTEGPNDGQGNVADFHSFHIEKAEWEPCFSSKGTTPAGRSLHTAVMLGEEMVVHGGLTRGDAKIVLNDTHAYHVATQRWRALAECPGAPRCGHTATALGSNTMWVFGGRSVKATHTSVSQDFIRYNLVTDQWTVVSVLSTLAPGKRWGHAACGIRERLYIHGGEGRHEKLADLWEYSTTLGTWTEIHSGTDLPSRFRHSLVSLGGDNGVVVAVGGLGMETTQRAPILLGHIVNQGAGILPHPLTTWGTQPPKGQSGAAVVTHNGFLFSFGGSSSNACSNVLTAGLLLQDIVVGNPSYTPVELLWQHLGEWGPDLILNRGGKTFPAHRAILQARAPLFASKLLECLSADDTTCLLEGNKRRQGMEGIPSTEALALFLQYLYTASIGPSDSVEEELKLQLDDMAVVFQIPHLTQLLQPAGPMRSKSDPARGPKDLEEAMLSLASSGTGDTTLRVEDPHTHAFQEIKVFGCILMAASEQIRKEMIAARSSLKTDVEMVVRIRAPHSALPQLLQFIYTGRATVQPDVAVACLIGANNMGLTHLKHMAEAVLYSGLTMETVVDTLSLASIHGARFLRMQCIELIAYMKLTQDVECPHLDRLTEDTQEEEMQVMAEEKVA